MAAQPLDAAAAALLQELGHADVSAGTWPTQVHCGRLLKCMGLSGAPGALDYCRSAVVASWAWLKCVLGVWQNACGCWGLLCPGLGGHGLNAFWEAVKKQVAGWGPWSLGLLQVCCRGALGMA